MMRACLVTVLLGLAGLAWNIGPARSEPLRIALVISNGRYASLPALARCTPRPRSCAMHCAAKGFEVIERSDLGRGEFDTAIGALAKRTAASPPSVAVLYYCGYALEFNGRSFLLPASATIARDNDVLTQGIIAKSLVDSLARVAESTGVVVLDGFQPPGAVATGLARLAEQIQPGNFAVIGANNDAAAPRADGGIAGLARSAGGRRGEPRHVHRRDAAELAKDGAAARLFVPATGRPSFLVGGRPPPAPPPPPAPVAAAPPRASPPPAASPPPVAPAAAPNAGDHGGRGSHVRAGSAAGPDDAGHPGILFRAG